jgi:hypothetical protein
MAQAHQSRCVNVAVETLALSDRSLVPHLTESIPYFALQLDGGNILEKLTDLFKKGKVSLSLGVQLFEPPKILHGDNRGDRRSTFLYKNAC